MESESKRPRTQTRDADDDQCPDDGRDGSSEFATTTHQGYNLGKDLKLVAEKKIIVQNHLQSAQNTELPRIENDMEALEKQMEKNTKHFDGVAAAIAARGEEISANLQRVVSELTQRCRDFENKNHEHLLQRQNELVSKHDQVNKVISSCKEAMASDNNVMIMDLAATVRTDHLKCDKKSPAPFQETQFIKGEYSVDPLLHYIMGVLSIQDIPTNNSAQEDLEDMKILSEFKYPGGSQIKTVAKFEYNRILVACALDENISAVDCDFEVEEVINVEPTWVNDFSVSPVTGTIWCCAFDNKTIYASYGGALVPGFISPYQPLSLCVTSDDKILVGTAHMVTAYSSIGQVLHSTEEEMINEPYHIASCTKTGNIAVCDQDPSKSGHEIPKPHLTVFNSELEWKYSYYGDGNDQYSDISAKDFDPQDVVFDSDGNILLVDCSSNSIHLVSSAGVFLSVIYTSQLKPMALAFVQKNVLCVGFHELKIRFFQYKGKQSSVSDNC